MIWLIVGYIDQLLKLFQYAGIIFIPIVLLIVVLIILSIWAKKNKKGNKKILSILKVTIIGLLMVVIVSSLTVRSWGPSFYKQIIKHYICGKGNYIEEQLEKKYRTNFTYISESKIYMSKDSGSVIGQYVERDYWVIYEFKDDDGVIAHVKYEKAWNIESYESNRTQYEIEQAIYDYAKENNFNKEFYVNATSQYDYKSSIYDHNSKLNYHRYGHLYFLFTEQSEENKNFIKAVIKHIYGDDSYISATECVLTKENYDHAVSIYEDRKKYDDIVPDTDIRKKGPAYHNKDRIYYKTYTVFTNDK